MIGDYYLSQIIKANIKQHVAGMSSFSFIGDPGCDGLGAEIMSIFHLALAHAAGDIVLIGGDIVPNGSKHFYENVTELIDSATEKPVYMLYYTCTSCGFTLSGSEKPKICSICGAPADKIEECPFD